MAKNKYNNFIKSYDTIRDTLRTIFLYGSFSREDFALLAVENMITKSAAFLTFCATMSSMILTIKEIPKWVFSGGLQAAAFEWVSNEADELHWT